MSDKCRTQFSRFWLVDGFGNCVVLQTLEWFSGNRLQKQENGKHIFGRNRTGDRKKRQKTDWQVTGNGHG
jgi:hypothetical protein